MKQLGTALLGWLILYFGEVRGKLASSPGSALSDILDDLDLHSDNRIRPGYGEKVLEIRAFTFLRNIIEINEARSTVTLSLLLMQMWEDPRLAFAGGGTVSNEILIDSPDFMARFWNPDTFIVNEVRTYSCMMSSEQRNLANQIVRLTSSGSVLKTSRLTVTVSCPMQHQSYPFYGFQCDIELESFGHKTDEIMFVWRNGSKSVDHSKIDATSLATKTSYSLTHVYTHSQQSYLDTGGSYSKLIIRLEFQKLWMRHAITFFIPTMVLTIGSLLTMWLLDCKHNCAGPGILTNFVIAGFIILLGSLEYSTTPILSQVPLLTPVDFQIGICVATVFSSVAYHGLSFCRMRSRCNCCGAVVAEDESVDQKKPLKRGHLKGGPSRPQQRLEPRKPDEESTYTKVTCYDSYDVTDQEDDGNDDELLQQGLFGECAVGTGKEAGENQREAADDGTINDIIGREGYQAGGQMSQARRHKRRVTTEPRFRATQTIWRIFLHLCKALSTVAFTIGELILVYVYVIAPSSSGYH